MSKIKANCLVCGKEFLADTFRVKIGLSKYCSKSCSSVASKGRKMPHSKEWEEKRLEAVRKSMENKIFKRGYKRPTEHVTGMVEGRRKSREKNPEKNRETCLRNLSKNKDGNLSKENSPKWKGGLVSAYKQWRNIKWKEFEVWRKEVLERDNYRCKECGSENDLQVHHIVPVAECREVAFLRMNGVVLCKKCHYKTESYGGKLGHVKHEVSVGKNRFLIRTIPHNFQDYNTVGNYATANGVTLIFVSDLGSDVYNGIVIVHEMVELLLCKWRGVPEDEITKFDIEYEADREEGNVDEPGFDPKSPYHREHGIATAVELLMCAHIDQSWNEYEKAVNEL